MEMALDELDAARDWMILLGRKTAREKIASFIHLLVRRSRAPGIVGLQQPLVLPLTQDEIGKLRWTDTRDRQPTVVCTKEGRRYSFH